MTSTPLSYWEPGSEERKLRIFISHRYEHDETLYDESERRAELARASTSKTFRYPPDSKWQARAAANCRSSKFKPDCCTHLHLGHLDRAEPCWCRTLRMGDVGSPTRGGWVRNSNSFCGHGRGPAARSRACLGSRRARPAARASAVRRRMKSCANIIQLVGGRPNWTMRAS